MKKRLLLITTVCVILACITYAQALKVPLLWDDEVTVSLNEFIKDWKFLPDIWNSHANRGGGEPGNFYRPVQDMSFMLDYSLWKLKPLGFHLTNIIIHIINIILLVQVLFAIFKNSLDEQRLFAGVFFAAALFAVHPAISEGVIYVSARSTMLSTLFWFCTLLCALKSDKAGKPGAVLYGLTGMIFFSLAILTKESVLTLPLIFIAFAFFSDKVISKKTAAIWALLLFSLVAVRLILFWPFGSSQKTLSVIADASLYQRILTVPAIITGYIGLLVFPWKLHVEHHFMIGGINDYRLWVSLANIVFVFLCLRALYKKERLVGAFSFAFIITLIPVLNILPIDATIAETWLYLPSAWLFAVVGYTLAEFSQSQAKRNRFIYTLFILCLVVLAVRTNLRIYTWRDALRLYLHDSSLSPRSFVLANNVGVEYFRRGDMEKAGEAFKKANDINDRYVVSQNNLGVVMERKGDFNGALSQYRKATQLSDYYLAYQNLGNLYRRMGLLEYAIASCEKAVEIFPEKTDIRFELALCYYQAGKLDKALVILKEIASANPGHPANDILRRLQRK